ncbi:hypothetical protein BHE74_00059466 [Ensete ventricosum]|nr:hypothetical protein BHE74_00059466 [Ensete ventricosum]
MRKTALQHTTPDLINARDDRRLHSCLRSKEESGRETPHTHSLSLSAWKQRTLYRGRLYLTDRLYPGVLWLEKGTFFGWDPIRGWVTEKGEGRTYGLIAHSGPVYKCRLLPSLARFNSLCPFFGALTVEMSVRRTTHQLSSGMIVSGPPEPPKERGPAVGLRAAPYTGGDVRKSGELGKMFDIPAADPGGTSRPVSKSHSGPLARSAPSSGSGPVPRKTSGPLPQIPPTGLITSGPARSSGGQTEQSPRPARKNKGEAYGGAVTAPEEEAFAFGVSRVWRWVLVGVFVAGLAAGAFVWVVVGRPEILIGVAALMAAVGVLAVWNWSMGRKEVERFWRCYANTSIDSRNLPIGKFVKITGVSSF